MKQQYERTVLNVTRFGDSDVITTSYEADRNNAYQGFTDLDNKPIREVR